MNYDELSKEKFERKNYFSTLNLELARMKFRISSSCVPGVRTHYPRKYGNLPLACPACARASGAQATHTDLPRWTMPRILSCGDYIDLKGDDFDINDDKMIAEFFSKVVKRRMDTEIINPVLYDKMYKLLIFCDSYWSAQADGNILIAINPYSYPS